MQIALRPARAGLTDTTVHRNLSFTVLPFSGLTLVMNRSSCGKQPHLSAAIPLSHITQISTLSYIGFFLEEL